MIGEKILLAVPWDTTPWKCKNEDIRIRVRSAWVTELTFAVDVAANINNHSGCVTAVRMFICREPLGLCMQAYNEPVNGKPERIERVKPKPFEALLGMMRWGIDTMSNAEITLKDEKRIADFLGGDAGKETENHNNQLRALHVWTEDALEKIDRKRREERGLFQGDDVDTCPDEIPQYALDWLRTMTQEDHVILYKPNGITGKCCACANTFKLTDYRWGDKFHHQTYTNCPICGESCYAVADRSTRPEVNYLSDAAFFQRGQNGILWLRQFHIRRDRSIFDDKNQLEPPYHKLTDWITEFGRFAIRDEHVALWLHEARSGYMGGNQVYWLDYWERKGKFYVAGNGSYNIMTESLALALDGITPKPRLAYCNLPGYMAARAHANRAPIMYTVRWAQYPVLEMLEKCGFRSIVDAKVCGYLGKEECKLVRFTAKSAKTVFALPREVMQLYQPDEWTIRRLRSAGILYRKGVKPEGMRDWLANRDGEDERLLRNIAPHMSKTQMETYLARQNAPLIEMERPKVTTNELIDYINECVYLERDMTNKTVLFPRDLRRAHEETSREKQFRQNEISKKQMRARVDKIKKYIWQKDGLLIRPAKSSVELSDEGKALHHCVGTYSERYAKGETEIWFIRRGDEPDKPYFTCEYKDGRIIQCRTIQNRGYETEPEVNAFAVEWSKKRASGWFDKQAAKLKKAAASKAAAPQAAT